MRLRKMQQELPDSVLLSSFQQAPGMAPRAAPGGGAAPPPSESGGLYYRTKRRPRFARSDIAQHPWEVAAVELEHWLDVMPQQIADAVMPGGRAPFTADAPRGEQLEFWRERRQLPHG